ncbi:MAG: DUF2063 domain-containing protein [Alphaproteobacteria bacterium]|nr:MAG: DUF2063 domain-containing protein [Alphaproteobacteria bacterium]
MTGLADIQNALRDTVLGDDQVQGIVHALVRSAGVPVAERIAVHRRNTLVLTCDALADTFPVVKALVGDGFFRTLGRAFVLEHPPRNATLLFYGQDFPDFIARFKPAQSVPYLADVARLEWAIHESYHAAEETPVDARQLGRLAPEKLAGARFSFHPALNLLHAPWAVDEIRDAHRDGPPSDAVRIGDGPVWLVVRRVNGVVTVDRASRCMWDALVALKNGARLGPVLAEAMARDSEFQASEVLAWLMTAGQVTGLTLEEGSGNG